MPMPHLTTPSLVVHTAMVLLCTVCGMLILEHNPLFALGLVALLGVLAALWVWPDLATGLVSFAVYTNLPVIATRFHVVPQLVAGAVVLLLAVPIVHALIIGKERVLVDHTFLLMLAFLVVLFAASCFARDTNIAVDWILTFVQEGIVLYVLIINAVRTLATLRRVIGVLLLAGSLLGALSLYQEVTRSYDTRFGGLAQRGAELGTETHGAKEGL
jgi:putative inorganic carbon (hco3(-)) transporter